jgi:(4-(4-[2-(gamma-L-glutamylamino)ethyl]phenoxymethyl)furan-2-yl)methanamine synthase
MPNETIQHQTVLGWDVGGAHLKAVLIDQKGAVLQVIQVACPLWRGVAELQLALDEILNTLTVVSHYHAITMTGELADIFPDRNAGVLEIADILCQRLPGKVSFFAGTRGMVSIADVAFNTPYIASANWLASASFFAQRMEQALFIDVGSTTSDFVLIAQGETKLRAYTDAERMQSEELVYTGVVRTPLMAISKQVPFAGAWVNTAAEHFATTADIYRLTGELRESDDMADTADGKGKSAEDSARRLARMVGHDIADASFAEWLQLAQAYKHMQLNLLRSATLRCLSSVRLEMETPVIGAGAGSFLVKALAEQLNLPYLDAADFIPSGANVHNQAETRRWAMVCLPAYAVANLYNQTLHYSPDLDRTYS